MRAILVLLLVAAPIEAQTDPCVSAAELGTVAGAVVDRYTTLPIDGAEVSITWRIEGAREATTHEIRTDPGGLFRLCDVPSGTRIFVSTEAFGRLTRIRAVEIEPGGTLDATLAVEAPRTRVTGRVIDDASNQPIAAASVVLGGEDGPTAVSDENGRFLFPGVPPGRFPVAVTHVAFTGVADSLGVELGTLIDVSVRMSRNVIPLAPIVVEVKSLRLERAGFYNRRDRGIGSYVTRPEIMATLPNAASDVLRRQPGVRLVRRRSGFGYAAVGRGECPFRYFVDGTRVGATFQIDDMDVDWIEALEIYRGPSTVPPEFSLPPFEENANCGIIAIWTRVR